MQPRSSRGRQGQATRPLADPVDTGLRLLGLRDHSREELRRKLSRRGHDDQAVEAALRRIHETYGLDDRAFARSYVRRRASARGPMAIAGELMARGIDRASVEASLAEFGAAEQLRSATHLAARLYANQPRLGYRQVLEKIGTKLIRRGFPTTIVRAACRSLVVEAAQLPED